MCILNSAPCLTQPCMQSTETQWQDNNSGPGTHSPLNWEIQVLCLTTGWIWNSTKRMSFLLSKPFVNETKKSDRTSFLKWNHHLPQVQRLQRRRPNTRPGVHTGSPKSLLNEMTWSQGSVVPGLVWNRQRTNIYATYKGQEHEWGGPSPSHQCAPCRTSPNSFS